MPSNFAGINANSKNPVEAYNFIKLLMSSKLNNWYFSTNNMVQNSVIDALASGTMDTGYNILGPGNLKPGQFSTGNMAQYKNILANVSSAAVYDRNILQIVYSTFSGYVNGTINSVDDAVNQLVEKVNFYLSE
jgi:ABC-type glycerol-3-phosphate transport system substrate-binding protein